MPIQGEKHRFNRKNVEMAPAAEGVYALFADEEVTYYGAARRGETIRSRLGRHLAGGQEPGRSAATTFSYEITSYPMSREAALLEEHRRSNHRLPRFNAPAPATGAALPFPDRRRRAVAPAAAPSEAAMRQTAAAGGAAARP